jgi:hypothetical protein
MNRYVLIRRLRGPAFLLLVGINALLAQAHIIGWSHSWPFYLILLGVLALAERAALMTDGPPPPPTYAAPYPGTPYPGTSYPGPPYSGAPYSGAPYTGAPGPAAPPLAQTSTSIVPAHTHDFENDPNGGHS